MKQLKVNEQNMNYFKTKYMNSLSGSINMIEDEDIEQEIVITVEKNENALYNTRIVIVGLGIDQINQQQVSTCLISVRSFNDNRFKERCRISKNYNELIKLDMLLRSQGYTGEQLISEHTFCSHAPQLVDETKVQLELYFTCILSSLKHIKDASCLVDFLNMPKEETKFNSAPSTIKEGYLSRKEGKLFGKWKARYFILNDNSLECYKFKGGIRKGTIELTDAIVGSQTKGDTNTEYRHTLSINEWIKVKQFNRHVLCAYNDEERDEWVNALTKVVHSLESTPITHRDMMKRFTKKQDYSYNP